MEKETSNGIPFNVIAKKVLAPMGTGIAIILGTSYYAGYHLDQQTKSRIDATRGCLATVIGDSSLCTSLTDDNLFEVRKCMHVDDGSFAGSVVTSDLREIMGVNCVDGRK